MITKAELNAFYQDMEHRANRILGQFMTLRSRPAELRYYSGHYTKNDSGDYQMDYFPIPVLSIEKLCDIEFHIDQIQITTKIQKEKIHKQDFKTLDAYSFEVYGLNDYTATYGTNHTPVETLIQTIDQSNENVLVFAFIFMNDIEPTKIKSFKDQLERLHFYY